MNSERSDGFLKRKAILLFLLCVTLTQVGLRDNGSEETVRFLMPKGPKQLDDKVVVGILLEDIIQALKSNNIERAVQHFASNVTGTNLAGKEQLRDMLLNWIKLSGINQSFTVGSVVSTKRGNEHIVDLVVLGAARMNPTHVKFILREQKEGWKIVDAGNLLSTLQPDSLHSGTLHPSSNEIVSGAPSLMEKSVAASVSSVSQLSSNPVSLRISSKILIPRAFDPSNTFWTVSAGLCQQYLGEDYRLYVDPTSMTMTGSAVGYTTDGTWNRIVFGSFVPARVASYGDWPSQTTFRRPNAITYFSSSTISPYIYVFVSDSANRRIVKLVQDGNNLVNPEVFLEFPTVIGLTDVTVGNPGGNGELWVSDAIRESIFRYGLNKVLFGRIQGYAVDGTTHKLHNPGRIAVNDQYLAFIDKDEMAVVVVPIGQYGYPQAVAFVKFPGTPQLTSISITDYDFSSFGVGAEGFFITDVGNSYLHKLSNTGEYLASYPIYTSIVSSVGYNDVYVLGEWTTTTGLTRYGHGNDILEFDASDQTFDQNLGTIKIDCFFPTTCTYTLKIVDQQNVEVNYSAFERPGYFSWPDNGTPSVSNIMKVGINNVTFSATGDPDAKQFTVNAPPWAQFSSPHSGEVLSPGQSTSIDFFCNMWEYGIGVYLSTNNGSTWTQISSPFGGDFGVNSFNWTVPSVSSSRCKLRLDLKNGNGDVYDSFYSSMFSIGCTPLSPPSWLTATQGEFSYVYLQWGGASGTCGLSGYNIYRRRMNQNEQWTRIVTGLNSSNYLDMPVFGPVYEYYITTVDIYGLESNPSIIAWGYPNCF